MNAQTTARNMPGEFNSPDAATQPGRAPSVSHRAPASDRAESAGSGNEAARFWRRHLADAPPLITLASDFPRPARRAAAAATVAFEISRTTSGELRSLCLRLGVPASQLFLGAFQTLLFRYTGQSDLVIGMSLEDLILATPLPMRQHLDFALPFSELLASNAGCLGEIRAHAHYPLSAIIRDCAPPASSSYTPLFQVVFAHLDEPLPPADAAALSLPTIPSADPLVPFDMTCTVYDTAAGFRGSLRFDPQLFETQTLRRWADNLLVLLESICAAPATPIGSLSLLSPAESEFIARSLDRLDREFHPAHPSVHAAFERQAARTPAAIAVRCGSIALTYEQLNARATVLACHLKSQGVAPGDLVGICTSRSPDMIAGVIAILKLGAAYVPLDPSYPVARLQAIATEARLRYVLCDEVGSGRISNAGIVEVPTCDAPDSPTPLQTVAIGPDTLSHVIFTSGSTGRPKGVMARHYNVLAFLDWVWSTFTPEELEVVLCCSSLCFDMTVFEIWAPLTTGGSLALVENPAALAHESVPGLTFVTTVPSAVRLLVDELAFPPSIKTVNVCGEPLDAQLVCDLFQRYPNISLYNTYGPTEDTAFSTFVRITMPCDTDPPIGAPLDHEYCRIVDPQGAPTPVGAIGELCVGGMGVAGGYLNNPEQTAARFYLSRSYRGVAAPEYRTGDFVRLRNDGLLQFVGRRDDQVKILGFRIDLGDIVSALMQLPGVTDACVLMQHRETTDALIAYVAHGAVAAASSDAASVAVQIEKDLRARLPAYMIPSAFVVLDELPLNENGKVDRHALRAMAVPSTVTEGSPATSDPTEGAVLEAFKSVLHLTRVGREDDFFAVGGNSLLAVRMTALLNEALGTAQSSRVVFENRTAASIAAALRRISVVSPSALEAVAADDSVVPTFPQLAMLSDRSRTSFNLCRAVWISGPLDEGALDRALAGLLRRHDALRTVFVSEGADVRMRCVPEFPSILTAICLPEDPEADLERLVLDEVNHERRRPFDLATGPLARAALIRISPIRHVFVFTVHHTVADEWSLNIIRRDLAAAYAAEVRGMDLELPPAPQVRFIDFVQWQNRMHASDEYRRQLGFWERELAAIESPPALSQHNAPFDGERRRTEYLDLTVPEELEERIRVLAARRGYTAYAVLMAALQLCLADHSQFEQQVVWSPVSRRPSAELEECVGMCTNLMVIATQVSGSLSLGEYLARVARKIHEGQANADVSALTAVMRNPATMPKVPMVGLNFLDLPNAAGWRFGAAEVVPIELRENDIDDMCALEVIVQFEERRMSIACASNPALFPAANTARIGRRLLCATDCLLSQPDRRIDDLMRSWREESLRTEACT